LPFASTELLPHSAHRCDDCRAGKVPADLPDEHLAAAIEREMRAVLDRHWRFVGTPALLAYLEAVARQVAATVEGAPSTVRVVLLEEAGLKTLALPSGTLVLSLGTLLFLEDEAELAFVLAHELTHAACADAATRIVRLGFDALARDGGESADSGFRRAADDLIALGYGRHRERDADARGLEALLALGYDPESALRYLRRLQQMVERGDPRAAEIALAHPTAADRARRLDRALFGRTVPQHGRVNREVFRRAAGHAVLTTRLERVRGFGEPPPETAAPSVRRPRRILAWLLAATGLLLAAVAWWLAR
jgi:predicted Zn-dependent protease